MKTSFYYIVILATALFVSSSCSKDDEIVYTSMTQESAVQAKTLELLRGKWISEKIITEYNWGDTKYNAITLPDTLKFLSHFSNAKAFYAYDYLQGKEVEVFKAHGTCEYRMAVQPVDYKPLCYFYISTDRNELQLYHAETLMHSRTFPLRFETETRFVYGATQQGFPMYFNRIE